MFSDYISEESKQLRAIGSCAELEDIVKVIQDTIGIVYVIGNGGSASTVSHFAVDMVKTAKKRVISLCDNSGIITAISNDYHFVDCYEKQVKVLVKKDDVLMAISVSGDSLNLIRGVQAAKRAGIKTIGLLGNKGGTLGKICDKKIIVQSEDYGIVEDIHLALCHMIAKGVN